MINLVNVCKNYGKVTAIENMSFTLHEPGIYCLLGRNGAGKTTLMKLISGSTPVSSGKVSVNGQKVTTLNMPENVRYIEAAKTQFNMRVSELFKMAYGLDPMFDIEFAEQMADKFKLNRKKKYNSLSFGMKTMVTTIISLASNDEIILLDEPVLGFDAIMRREFYELLQLSFEKNPRIIIVSTHLIDEIAYVASQIIIIDEGKLLINEDINTLTEKSYKVSGVSDSVNSATQGLNVIAKEDIGKFTVAYVFDNRIAKTEGIEIGEMTLGDLFVKMIGGKEDE